MPTRPCPPPRAVAAARAVVGDLELDLAVAVADEDLRLVGARVLERVRQALLDEPVGRQVDAGRKLRGLALDPQLDRQPGLPNLLDELVEVLEARLRGERGRLLGPAQDADEAAHLGQRLAAGLLDDLERLALLLLLGPQEPPDRRRLDGHDADAVADDVVQLTREPCPFLRDRLARALLAFPLEASRALVHCVGFLELAAEGEAGHPDHAEDERDEDVLAEARAWVVPADDRNGRARRSRGRQAPRICRAASRTGRCSRAWRGRARLRYGTSRPSKNELTPATTNTNAGAANGQRRRASSGSVISRTTGISSQSDESGVSASGSAIEAIIDDPARRPPTRITTSKAYSFTYGQSALIRVMGPR